ncbi:MAG: DEAD/DEAH box helicase family protein [Clostridia bacterium]|nr:DEAD/DEAH box helicase family protein [Clostridia bacterium]
MEELFGIENFNIIQDEENYYFFRALNMADNRDVEEGITLDGDGRVARIRTDRERYLENPENGTPKYNAEDEISLEQAHDHIKVHYRKDTNCISLASDANVVIDYGRGNYKDRYVMVKISKKEMGEKVKFAGQYMLEEIEKRVKDYISSLNPDDERDSEILEELDRIEKSQSTEEIKEIVKTTYTGQIDISKSGMKQGIQYRAPVSRFSEYQTLNDEQNLAKNKLVGKLTLLERKDEYKRLLLHANNSKILETIGSAFSSMELLHYGDIQGEVIQEVPSKIMDMFSLIQQVKADFPNINELKSELVDFTKFEMKFNIPENSILNREDKVKDNFTIEEMYNLTAGRVAYGNADSIIKNVFYLAKSQVRARELANVLNQITGNNPNYAEIIDYIYKNGFEIEPDVITRKTGKGYQISEAVSLDLKENERNLVEEIKQLSNEELLEIMQKGGLSDTRGIITKNFLEVQENEKISLEDYYAEAIIDLHDWQKLGIEEFTIEQRNDLIKKLKESECVSIYKKLKDAQIPEKDIPKYLINIASRDNLKSILNEENFVELIKQNEQELKQELSIPQIETYLGYYAVNETGLVLRDYQRNAVVKTDEIFENKKFASVVLPTGGGKSFVALTELMEHKDEKMLYLAPSNEILEQMKDYIIEYVHGLQGTLGKKSKEEIIAEVFHNIAFETYPGLLAKKGKETIKQEYGFIVLDELHRTGASEWEDRLDQLLENQNENVKVLGITATPTRDMDDRNMANETALKLGYTPEEVQKREHIAMDMDLVEAIKLGLVVNPKIVSCEYSLKTDGRMEDLLETINSIEDENVRKEKLAKYEQLRRSLDEAEGIPEILQSNVKPGGKYIVFIPVTDKGEEFEDEDGNKIGKKSGADKIKECEKDIKEKYLKNSGINLKCYSMLGAYGDKKNEAQLKLFETDESKDTKFMIVMNKANEGLHVKGIDGIIWFRALDENSKILYLQQLGRAIYSEDPNNPTPDEKRPIIIDLVNNTLNVDIDKEIKNNNRLDDLQLLSVVVDWVKMHNGLPDIDSTNKTEQRYAATLYRIQNKYQEYLNGFENYPDLDEKKKIQIQTIIEKGLEIDLWDTELPPKSAEDIDKIINVDTFEVRGLMKDFVELENEVDEIAGSAILLKNALKIEKWCEENFGDKPVWERRLPNSKSEDEEEKRLGIALGTIRIRIKQYEGIPIEQIEDEDDRKITEIIERLDREYAFGRNQTHNSLGNALEIENWCEEKFKDKKPWERRLPTGESKDEEEKRLGKALKDLRKKLKQYEGIPIEQIEDDDARKIAEILEELDREYAFGFQQNHCLLGNALEIENWCEENFREKKPWERRLPTGGSKDEEEKRLGCNWNALKTKIKQYEGIPIEEIEDEDHRKIAEIMERLDREYAFGRNQTHNSLGNALEIENWCKEKFEEKKLWERRSPSQNSSDEEEKRLGQALSDLRKKLKQYEGIPIEQIEDKDDRKIAEIIERLDREYAFGEGQIHNLLGNALEIENWCKEKFGDKPVWKRKTPSQKSTNEEEKKLGNELQALKKKRKKYEGIPSEKIENEEDRKIVEIVRRIEKKYAFGEGQIHNLLGNTLEIENWCKEKFGDKPVCERKLPSLKSIDEEEKRLGRALKTIKNRLKQYKGIPIEKIEDEEDRKIAEIIDRLDREYNYKKTKAQDVGEAGFEVGIGDIDKFDEVSQVFDSVVEKTKEETKKGGTNRDE